MLLLVKVVLLGNAAVRKTSLRRRWMGEGFTSQYIQTIGADFSIKEIKIKINKKSKTYKYQVWDLAGQIQFHAVRKSYYHGALGAIIMYDITNTESFQSVPVWINELWNNNKLGVTPFILVANKIDLRNEVPQTLTLEQGKIYAKQLSELTLPHGFEIPFIETSAKTGENVDRAFQLLGETIIKYAEPAKSQKA